MTTTDPATSSPGWLSGGGEMGERIRTRDWSRSPLGPVLNWRQSLRTAVGMMLPSRAQIILFWGPEFVVLYNDAYRPVFGGKHPGALGLPGREAWSEIWEGQLGPLLRGVVESGESFGASDLLFTIQRHGFVEETYFDISYDPVRGEQGDVEGVNCIVTETTGRVVGERRLRALSGLGRIGMRARTVGDALERAAEVLGAHPEDIAFALLYDWDATAGLARRCACAGIAKDHPAAVAEVRPGNGAPWPLGPELQGEGVVLEGAALPGVALPGGRWPDACTRVAVIPIAMPGQPPDGFIVAGTSPRRPLDDAYRDFLRLAATGIGSALVSVKALKAERERVESLAELDRAKTTFFSNVSHEFRTPLTLLLGPLRDEIDRGDLPAGTAQRLDLAYRNGVRLLKLVNALLDFSRIEAGRMQAHFQATDLAQLTVELASNFDSACRNAGLGLVIDCPALPEPVFVDRDMWEKVVLNLMSNAFKHTFEGGIEVRLRSAGDRAVLTVRDTGVGIAPEAMPRLFERFHRVEAARSRTHEGSGIGLALVHELVRMHGGEIRAESRVDQGSVFEVAIPRGRAHLPAEQVIDTPTVAPIPPKSAAALQEVMGWMREPGAGEAVTGAARGPERVLVAEDNADMREYMERLLGEHWHVTTVGDGQAAMHALLTAPCDLLITDVMMPVMDGFALLAAVRSEEALRDLPVLMLSARAGEEARIEGRGAGADDYLVKPFSARELVAQVRAQLATARARRAIARERELLLANERSARMDVQRQWDDLVRLFEQAPNPMVILRGRDYRIELANRAACEVWNRSLDEVLHRPLFEALPDATGQGLEALLAGVMATGEPYAGRALPVRLRRGNGQETVYFDFVYSPLRATSGRVEGIAVIAFDVTERVNVRAELDAAR